MPLVVDSDPLSPTCNSYVSEAEMDSYVSDRVVDSAAKDAWTSLAADLRATYLVNATRQLDSSATWIGSKYSSEQKLSWPRMNAWVDGFLLDSTIVPDAVKEATCEMLLWLLGNSGQISQQQDAAYDSIKVGSLVIDFNEQVASQKDKYFPDIVAYILHDYASMHNPNTPSNKSIKTVRLERA